MPNHYLPIPQSSAQNPFRAEDFCSIIIETRHRKDTAQHNKVKSLKLIERMTNIVIIFVLSTNATVAFFWTKTKISTLHF